ncbi:MAG: DegV family protein [Acidimicrobiales bacterium]
MIGVCTDSNAQLPEARCAAAGIEVVPITVTLDGVDYLEGVDLDADGFYAAFAAGRSPTVATAAPSPARFFEAYRRLVDRGATEILSVHIGSDVSGTLNSARLGAEAAPVRVRLVDTGSASFAVACASLAATEAIAAGAGLEEAAAIAEAVAGRCGNVFTVGTLDLARAGGRLAAGEGSPRGAPVLSLRGGQITSVGSAASALDAARLMADHVLAAGHRLRVGVGTSDPSSIPVAEALAARLRAADQVHDIIAYRVGPSVGAHTGPGTAGAVYHEMA